MSLKEQFVMFALRLFVAQIVPIHESFVQYHALSNLVTAHSRGKTQLIRTFWRVRQSVSSFFDFYTAQNKIDKSERRDCSQFG